MIPKHPDRVGPFPVVRVLGAGGMGVVYEVRDPKTGRSLALKQLRLRGASERTRVRFAREAEILAKIRHPGVVTVHTLGRTREGPYLVEEVVQGQPLDRIAEEPGLPVERATQVVRDLASALHHVHGHGVLHRDLKPGNVVLRSDGAPVLLDFGLAREVDAETLTQEGAPLGTLAFMSPEQARGTRGSELTPATDVYGLGAILYALLTRGVLPFEEQHPAGLLYRLLNDDVPPPSTHRPEVPPELDAVCRVAMARDAAERYPDMEAFGRDLERVLAGEPPEALAHAGASATARGRWIGVAAVLLVLALAGAGALAWGSTQEDASTEPQLPTEVRPVEDPADRSPPPVWTLNPAQDLALVVRYAEEDTLTVMHVHLWIDLHVTAVTNGVADLACTLTRVRCSFGNAMTGAGNFFDTDTADEQRGHPLSAVRVARGTGFSVGLRLQDGAVEHIEGVDQIGKAVTKLHKDHSISKDIPKSVGNIFSDAHFKRVFGRSFSDALFGGVLDSLCRSRSAPDAVLRWLEPEQQGETLIHRLGGDAPRGARISPLSPGFRKVESEHRFEFDGESVFEGGALRSGWVSQRLVSKTNLPVSGSVPSARWELERTR